MRGCCRLAVRDALVLASRAILAPDGDVVDSAIAVGIAAVDDVPATVVAPVVLINNELEEPDLSIVKVAEEVPGLTVVNLDEVNMFV